MTDKPVILSPRKRFEVECGSCLAEIGYARENVKRIPDGHRKNSQLWREVIDCPACGKEIPVGPQNR